MNRTQKGILMATLTPVLWGLMSIPIRTLAPYGIGGQDLAFFRCLAAGLGLLIENMILNRQALRIDFRGLLLCLCYGAFCYATSFTAYALAVKRIPVAVAMVLMFLCPVWVSLLNLLIFRERLRPVNCISIVICLTGAVLVSNLISVRGERLDLLGIICALVNSLGCGLQLIIPRYFEKDYSKDAFMMYGFLGSALILAFITHFETVAGAAAADPGVVISNILFLSVILTFVANTVFVKAANYIDSTLVSIISALEVVVGSMVGLFLYHETMSPSQAFGAVIIVIGALLPNLTLLIGRKNHENFDTSG
jgi:drug/metabolite transporter (DMT)-like permease